MSARIDTLFPAGQLLPVMWHNRSAEPVVLVDSKTGTKRPATLRDARKHDLVPSTHNVLAVLARPEYAHWCMEQAAEAALMLRRRNGESSGDFMNRILLQAEHTRLTSIAMGCALREGVRRIAMNPAPIDGTRPMSPQLLAVRNWLNLRSTRTLDAGRHFLNDVQGYAGTSDLHLLHLELGPCCLYVHSRGRTNAPPVSWLYEAAAACACYNGGCWSAVTLSVDPATAELTEHMWEEARLKRGWEGFQACARLWRDIKDYDPRAYAGKKDKTV